MWISSIISNCCICLFDCLLCELCPLLSVALRSAILSDLGHCCGIWHVNSTCWSWQILSHGRSSINLMQTTQISKLWKTSWQMSSTTWDWFQNPEDSHGKMPLWHALFFGQSKFLSHIRGNVAGRTWANVLRNEHRILMSQVMRAKSWLILSIGTKSWELSPLNHTNHTRLCTFESCE